METNSGKAMRVAVVLMLLYAAYMVGKCPCAGTTLLSCENHANEFAVITLVAPLLVLAHPHLGTTNSK